MVFDFEHVLNDDSLLGFGARGWVSSGVLPSFALPVYSRVPAGIDNRISPLKPRKGCSGDPDSPTVQSTPATYLGEANIGRREATSSKPESAWRGKVHRRVQDSSG